MDSKAGDDKKDLVAGYGRVSTQKQVIEGTSAEDQKNRIEKECDKNDWILTKFYSDDGFSGKTMEHRPGIQKLIRDAKDGKFKAVLFTKLDRIGRSLRELLNFWNLMQEEYKLDLICIDVPAINTKGPFSTMMLAILGGFAEFERSLIRERMSIGRLIKWKEGKTVVGALPYGYDWDDEAGAIVIHDKQSDIVRQIYSMYLHENYSFRLHLSQQKNSPPVYIPSPQQTHVP